jgi:hypothetical protein
MTDLEKIKMFESPQAPEHALTVREVIERLSGLDPDAPVVFQTPHYGVFGANKAYGVTTIRHEKLARREHFNPAEQYEDDETGEQCEREVWLQVWPEWTGVVLRGNGI